MGPNNAGQNVNGYSSPEWLLRTKVFPKSFRIARRPTPGTKLKVGKIQSALWIVSMTNEFEIKTRWADLMSILVRSWGDNRPKQLADNILTL